MLTSEVAVTFVTIFRDCLVQFQRCAMCMFKIISAVNLAEVSESISLIKTFYTNWLGHNSADTDLQMMVATSARKNEVPRES